MGARLDGVLFDVDDTLYSTTAFAERARAQAVEAMIRAGLRTPPERVREVLRDVLDDYQSNFPYQFDEVLARLPAAAYQPVNPAIIVASAVAAYHDTKFRELRPFEDVTPALAELKRRGVRMGVVTAGIPVKQAEKLVRLGLVEFFEPAWVFVADQLEATKHDRRLWEIVSARTGVEPARCLYVGDNPATDVDVPNELGMATVLVRREGRHARERGRTRPAHEIDDFAELDRLLRSGYGL